MSNTTVTAPRLMKPLTDSFAVYTGIAGRKINPYTEVLNVMTDLIREDAKGQTFLVRDNKNLQTKPLKDLAKEVFGSPLFPAASLDNASTTFNSSQIHMLEKVSAFLKSNQISETQTAPGEAYLFSVMLLNNLHERQLNNRPSKFGTYEIELYSPKSGQTGFIVALG